MSLKPGQLVAQYSIDRKIGGAAIRLRFSWGLVVVGVLAAVVGCESGGGRSGPPETFLEVLQRSPFLPQEAQLDLRKPESEGGRPAYSRPSRFVLGEGWSWGERLGTWSDAPRSTLFVVLNHDPDPLELYLECQPFRDPSSPRQQTVQITINGSPISLLTLEPDWHEYRVAVPEGALQAGVNRIELEYGYQMSPTEPGRNDQRRLAVRFARIALLGDRRSWEEQASSEPRLEGDQVILRSAGRLISPFRYPEGPAKFAFTVSAQGHDAARLRLLHAGVFGGEPEELVDKRTSDGEPGQLFSDGLELSGRPGDVGCLILDLEPGAGGRITIEAAEFTAEPGPGIAPPATLPVDGPAEPPKTLPDVVVIVLDAARPDHFGCYGYPRNTTPRIDALARESLVFRNAFAGSSYTRASAPTMFSGLGFADHRVATKEDRLDESATTLAEYLADIGYRTVCYSASPHNSIQSGMAQGCEEFEELWRIKGDLLTRVDPFRLSARATAKLSDADDDRPLFLMLHYVPPHEPYHPTPEYDAFTSADQASDIDGTVETLRGVNSGKIEWTPERRARLIELYDGNLLKGDAAAGQVLDALMARERWNDTVVLVVSDHGEAFGEHGRLGHGATVYDEMLRVPFILRLPAGAVPQTVDTEGLVSLADIVPTILGIVGVEPDPRVGGIDLLGGTSLEGRSIIANSGRLDYAYRTLDWKAIIGSSPGKLELYHLAVDGSESENLVLQHLDQFFCIQRVVEQTMAGESWLLSATRAAELGSEDLEVLRSLGYVD